MKLDVGCGTNPRGDVNCDLYIEDVDRHRGLQAKEYLLDTRKIKNFVRCSALHLPFKNKAFREVFCAQVIEHLPNPYLLMKELVRVAKKTVVVETVHRHGNRIMGYRSRWQSEWNRKHHISHFGYRWFSDAALKLGWCVTRKYELSFISLPHVWVALLKVPYEIGFIIEPIKVNMK